MARTHGRIYSRIWSDDFTALSTGAQRAYMFLVSQTDLTQAGVLGLRLKRWAKLAKDSTADTLRADLAELEQARYIVVDDDDEEVLIRTFIRNDGVYKQPNVMLRAVEDCREIKSARIKAVLLVELDRIPLDELSSEVKGVKSARGTVQTAIADMRKILCEGLGEPVPDPMPDPSQNPTGTPAEPFPEPYPKGSGNPSGTLPGTLPGTPAEGLGEGSPRARVAPACAPVAPIPVPLSPDPCLVAAPAPTTAQETLAVEVAVLPPPEPNPIPILTAAYIDAYRAGGGIPTEAVIKAAGKNIKRLVEVDQIEPPILLLAVQRAATARSKDLDRYLGEAQQRYGQTQTREAMRAHWYERAERLDSRSAS